MKKLMLGLMAGLLLLGSLRAFAQDQAASEFEVYEQVDAKVVLIPLDMAQRIDAIDKSDLADAAKVSQVVDLIVQLANDTSEKSFCVVSTQDRKNQEEAISKCHKKLNKERIVSYAQGKLLSQEQLNSLKIIKEVTALERLRIGYSVAISLLIK